MEDSFGRLLWNTYFVDLFRNFIVFKLNFKKLNYIISSYGIFILKTSYEYLFGILMMYVLAAENNVLNTSLKLCLIWNTCFEDFLQILISNTH